MVTTSLAGVRKRYLLATEQSHCCRVIERDMNEDRADGSVMNGCCRISIS